MNNREFEFRRSGKQAKNQTSLREKRSFSWKSSLTNGKKSGRQEIRLQTKGLMSGICSSRPGLPRFARNDRKCAFTLAETLITLVIVGIVAAVTVPALMNKIDDYHFKVAYKKAYSDINQAFQEDITYNQFPAKTGDCYDENFADYTYNKLKEKFKVMKTCENKNAFTCWVAADKLGIGPTSASRAFIDISGRVWIEHTLYRAFYLVDTNGDKKPNKFGKDRWQFAFLNYPNSTSDCIINPAKPIRIQPLCFYDKEVKDSWCNYPPCYYKKWLSE